MSIKDFLKSLGEDREFQLQVAGYKYIQPVPARYAELKINDKLRVAFSQNGIDRLYLHQTTAVELIRKGGNVVFITPTASGKSMVYNIPVLETVMDDPHSTALYLFPLNGSNRTS